MRYICPGPRRWLAARRMTTPPTTPPGTTSSTQRLNDTTVSDAATADATLLRSPVLPESTGTECSISPFNADPERVILPCAQSRSGANNVASAVAASLTAVSFNRCFDNRNCHSMSLQHHVRFCFTPRTAQDLFISRDLSPFPASICHFEHDSEVYRQR